MDNESMTQESAQTAEGNAPRGWLLSFMDHVEGQVAFGDTKASLLLTADSILLAAMSAVITGEHPLIDRLSPTSRTLLVLAFLALVIGFLFALATLVPNRKNLWTTKITPSPVNFAWIGRKKEVEEEDYVKYALSMKAYELNVSLARVIYGKSVWARKKFQRLYFATVATTVGVITAVLAILVELIGAGA